ncbi:MAG: hypothetical protein PHE87_09385 [Victivallaceae bacterium]|nr:hypothetical protein [Victivallaceae bacterium]
MSLKVAYFQADATPPIDNDIMLCFGGVPSTVKIADPLSARGIVIFSDDLPVVLCAVDWVGIANESHDEWCKVLATAAGTSPERVSVHCLHQHDTPGMDRAAFKIISKKSGNNILKNIDFEDSVIKSTADALKLALGNAEEVSHISIGKARVDKFASNRRIQGPDGKVIFTRFTTCIDEIFRCHSEGVIDPFVRSLCFYNQEKPLISMTYYATHPQSFYRKGTVSADTVGLARYLREAMEPGVNHIHFCGAGGNIGAGKYNDGSPENRFKLAGRLAKGMREAWETSVKIPVAASDFSWKTLNITLPIDSKYLEADAEQKIHNEIHENNSAGEAQRLSYLLRRKSGQGINLSCMKIGPASVLHMPGELFVEYQLAAQAMLPGEMVCMAAYGDYGPSYIGTAETYSQGGYEASADRGCPVPEVEAVLMEAMQKLLSQ